MLREIGRYAAVGAIAILGMAMLPATTSSNSTDADVVSKVDLSYLVNTRRPIWMGPVFRYTVYERSKVEARVTSLTGELVLILHVGEQEPGQHTLPWDGTTDDGQVAFEGKFHFELFFGDEYAADFWFTSKSLTSFDE